MDTAAIRRARVNKIIDEQFGTVLAEFARAIERDDAQVWQYVKGDRNIGERMARHIEAKLKLARGDLDVADSFHVAQDRPSYGGIPVVGTAQLGPDGFWDELGYPTGHGDGFIDYPMRDKNAYAVRVKGDSMRPRIKPGEYVIIEPSHAVVTGDEVLVKIRDGRRIIKRLGPRRKGTTEFQSVNEDHKPFTMEDADIEAMHFVSAIVNDSWYRSEI